MLAPLVTGRNPRFHQRRHRQLRHPAQRRILEHKATERKLPGFSRDYGVSADATSPFPVPGLSLLAFGQDSTSCTWTSRGLTSVPMFTRPLLAYARPQARPEHPQQLSADRSPTTRDGSERRIAPNAIGGGRRRGATRRSPRSIFKIPITRRGPRRWRPSQLARTTTW